MSMNFYHLDRRHRLPLENKFTGDQVHGVVRKVTWLTLHIEITSQIPEGMPTLWKFSRRSGKGWRTDCPFRLPLEEAGHFLGLQATGVTCPSCGTWVYSRAHHDCRKCPCGEVYVDGGFDYIRVGFHGQMPPPERRHLDYHITKSMLHDDWNYGKTRFGWVST